MKVKNILPTVHDGCHTITLQNNNISTTLSNIGRSFAFSERNDERLYVTEVEKKHVPTTFN